MTENIWTQIQGLRGRDLHTLGNSTPFTVSSVDDDKAVLRFEDGSVRKIDRPTVEAICASLLSAGHIFIHVQANRSDLRGVRSKAYYVAAMLAALNGIQSALPPLRLYLDKAA